MKNKQKESLSKTIFKYASSHVYWRSLGLISAFIKPKLLSPELYGLWSILSIIPNFSIYNHLGSHDGMRYQIPYNEAKKDYVKNEAIKGTVFYGSLYLNALIAAALLLLSLAGDFDIVQRLGLMTMAVVVLLTWYSQNYTVQLKAYQNFKLIGTSNYIKANVTCFSTVLLIYFLGIYGIYITAILTLLASVWYFRVKCPMGTLTRFNYGVFKDMVKMGFPITFFNLNNELMKSSDRIIIGFFLGTKLLGFYAIAAMVFGFLMDIPGVAREVVEPRLMEGVANDSRENNLREYFLKPLINTAYFMPFLIGPVYFFFPHFIHLALPRYVEGITPTLIIVIGGYFLSLVYVARGIIVANKWQSKASLIMVSVLPLNIGLSIFFINIGLSINGVALGSSISYFVLFISLLAYIRKQYDVSSEEWRTNLIGLCMPFPVMALAIALIPVLSDSLFSNQYIGAIFGCFFYFLIMFLLQKFSAKKFPLLKKIEITKMF